MKGFGQQRNLQVSHYVGTKGGKKLRIDHIPGSQISYLQPSIKDIEQYQKNPIHGHHQPMTTSIVGSLHLLIIKMQPYIPKSRSLQGKDNDTE